MIRLRVNKLILMVFVSLKIWAQDENFVKIEFHNFTANTILLTTGSNVFNVPVGESILYWPSITPLTNVVLSFVGYTNVVGPFDATSVWTNNLSWTLFGSNSNLNYTLASVYNEPSYYSTFYKGFITGMGMMVCGWLIRMVYGALGRATAEV